MYAFTFIIFALVGFQQKVNVLSNEVDIICRPTFCDPYCPYGPILDVNGCTTCSCFDPCANVSCPIFEECKVEPLFCPWQSCGFIGRCGPQCPLVLCADDCPYGFEYDSNGCQTCTCINHCKNQICAPGEICVIEDLCTSGTCGIKPKCTKQCIDLPCPSTASCQYGFEMDCDNCPTCTCRNPCAGVVCPRYQYCAVKRIFCVTTPCPPPSASCQSYCPDNNFPLIGRSDFPVQCSAGDLKCPKGYKCTNIRELNESYCCRDPQSL